MKSKGSFIRITAAMVLLLTAYFIASLFQSDDWGNILSPINALSAAGILIFAYLKSPKTKASQIFLLFTLACAVWGAADIVWAVISYGGGSPEDSPVLWIIYVLTNCFLLCALVVFAVHQFRKWDLVLFGIDLIINGLLTVVLFWIVFLGKEMTAFSALLESDFTSLLSILTDIMMCIIIFSWVFSVRDGKIQVFLRMMAFGMVLFAFTDMFYYYLDYNGLYFPNSINDFLYVLSLEFIAFGALWKTYKNDTAIDFSVLTNTGGKGKWIFLLLYPIFSGFLSVTGLIDSQLDLIDIITFAILIFIYRASCRYVQIALEKEALLKQSNEILEQRVSEQVSELKFLANQDTLTTLYNRRYFMACLEETVRGRLAGDTVGLLLIDMDRFKTVNDTFGHDVGDKVLIDISYRLIEWNNYGATIARLGGDEFAVMLAGKYTQEDIVDCCTEIIGIFNTPVIAGDHTLNMTTSVGIAILLEDDCDIKKLMQNADIAMYRAKSQGYNRYQVYDVLMSQDYQKAIEIEALLKQTDADRDFELYYQPQYALPGRELIGAEALIRWNNAEHGFIPPNVFIPIAEQIDYIFKIGEWVLRETIRQAELWNTHYDFPFKVGFNISPKQLRDENFVALIRTLVTHQGFDPRWLDAEITESFMMNNDDCIKNMFSVFRELGITVSIDDFGSGYSALGNLNNFPFDRIKIAKSLIDNISVRNPSGINIVRAAINMAHASGIQTIAEGVEKREQLEILTELGCDQVQGYLLGRPVPADIFVERYIERLHDSDEVC